MNDPTCLSLFSGIGGLDLGLARAGFRHLGFCESDPYRRDVLRARWPGVPIHDDVRALPGSREERRSVDSVAGCGGTDAPAATELRAVRGGEPDVTERPTSVDLLCGGFPCQDLSVAGQRKGLDGDRSGLFFEFARIAEAVRPRWVLVENVPGLLSSQGGRDFGTVLGTLADIGYGLAWRILDSRYFGVPQRRRRVYIVGTLANGDPRAAAERAGQVLAVGTRCPGHPATRGEAGQDVAGTLGGGAGERGWAQDTERMTFVASPPSHGSNPNSNAAGHRREDDENLVAIPISSDATYGEGIAKTLSRDAHGNMRLRDPGIGIGEPGDPAYTVSATSPGSIGIAASVRRLTPVECERLQALPDGWTDLGGTADSKRYAALGDAVTATVAEWIGRRLASEERGD